MRTLKNGELGKGGAVTLTIVATHPYYRLYRRVEPYTATVTVTDNEPAGLWVMDAEANEADGTLDFRVLMRPDNPGTVTVDYATANGTAAEGSDYSLTEGTLTFTPGVTEQTVSVPILADTVADDGEKFTLMLSNATGADIHDGDAVGTIRDMPVVGSGPLTGFMLVDGASGTDLGAITEGAALTLPDPHGGYRITVGTTADSSVGSVSFALSGAKAGTATENHAPFTLFAGAGHTLPAGSYTLSATAYPEDGARGEALQTLSVSFTVTAETVPTGMVLDGFTLTDAATQAAVGTVTDGSAFTLPASGRYEISTDLATGQTAGSVHLELSGVKTATRTDAAAPYELFGAGQALPAGAYTVRALAYAAAGRGGDVLQTLTASFTVAEPLTAALERVPDEHDGSPFSFRVRFSEGVPTTDAALLAALTVTGGTATASRRVGGADDLREVDVEPTRATTDVTVALAATADCAAAGAVCTADGRKLSNADTAMVEGVVWVSVSDGAGSEGGTAAFEVTLSAAHVSEVTVDYATRDSSAKAGSDYTATSDTLTFAAGVTSKTVSVALTDDGTMDDGEVFWLVLSNPSGVRLGGNTPGRELLGDDQPGVGRGTIRDSAALSEVSTHDASAREGSDAAVVFVVVVDPASTGTVTVDYATSDGTATAGDDYVDTSGTLTFDAGQTFMFVRVPVVDDNEEDSGETFTLTLSSVTGASLPAATATATGTIWNSEAPALSVADAEATEGAGAALAFEVTLAPAATGTVTVDYATHDGTARAGEDYTARRGTLEFAAGETSKTVSVPVTDDEADDDGETLTLALTAAKGAAVAEATATGTIRDAGPAALPALSVADAEASEEDDAALSFAVTLDRAATVTVTVDYATSDGTATAGEDYTDTSGTLEFAAGETSKTVSVPITADSTEEADETLTLTLSSPTNATLGTAAATGTIRDNDGAEADVPTITAEGGSATEGETVAFTVTLSEATSAEVSVDYKTGTKGAASGVDFTRKSGTLTFEANETSKTIEVETIEDEQDEGDETIKLTLSNPVNATLGTTETTATIVDDDEAEAVVPTITAVGGSAEEGETVTFTLTLSEATSAEVSVDYKTGTKGAASGADFTRKSGTLTFEANETSKTIAVETIEDEQDEDDETIKLTLSNAINATLGTTETTATIEDDDDPPLTATFQEVPKEHDGESTFSFEVLFSEKIPTSYKVLRDQGAFRVSGGSVRKARRVNGRDDLREIHIEPSGYEAVTVTLPPTTDCNASGAICMDDGRKLSNSNSATIAGPVGISVADAQVEEEEGAVLAFMVTLSRAASSTLTVDYATSDGSALVDVDYREANGTLTFQAGDTAKTIEVAVIDDAHNEDEETLSLSLSNASSGRLTDAEATGTIKNRDPLPRALLARFGRTAAVHVVEQVEERIAAPREPGIDGRFAGLSLRPGVGSAAGSLAAGQFGAPVGAQRMRTGLGGPVAGAPLGGAGPLGTPGLGGGGAGMASAAGPMGGRPVPGNAMMTGGGLLQMGYGGEGLLTGSAFSLNRETRQGGILSLWSRGARSYFSGREGTLSLGGDVRTTMFGADYAKGPLMAGLSLSHSQGLGEYAGAAGGQLATAVTGLYPWLGYKATDRVTVWGVGGYGVGGMLLTPDGGPALESGLSMAMAAAGTRGELVAGGSGGFELAFKADALWVGTSTDGVDGPAGRLKATEAAVTRFRTGLEGSRAYTLAGRLSLTPSVEMGLRHDGGDAENGAGMDVGAGLVVAEARTGLAVDVRVRMLVVHQAEGFRERGVALSLSYNPRPSTPLGFTARVAPSWGGQAQGGAEALWGRESMAGMAHGGFGQGSRLDGEVGYGLPVGSRFVGTPRVGFSTSEYGRDYRIGYGLGVLDRGKLNLQLGVDAQRRQSPMLGGTSNGVVGRASIGW